MIIPEALDCPLMPLHPLPRVTADLLGCGGEIRVRIEDFEVEEIPLYEPEGTGDHLFLWIEKIDVPAETLRRHVARSLDVPAMDVGMAGLKDRRAVTRQWLSVPRSREALIGRIDTDRIHVLQARPHRNKLRTAHLAGNRFRIRVRGAVAEAGARVVAKLERFAATGVPNFYGSQRMGQGGSTLAAGWALLQGSKRIGRNRLVRVTTGDGAVHSFDLGDRPLRRLAASALQSEVFNRTVARRLQDGTMATVLPGDVCRKTAGSGPFVSDDAARDQQRLRIGEIQITGPMWGPKMMRGQQQAGELEAAVLADCGIEEADLAELGALAEGTRRSMVIFPEGLAWEPEDDGLTVTFTLSAGSFATVVWHELMGPLAPGDAAMGPENEAEPATAAVADQEGAEPCA